MLLLKLFENPFEFLFFILAIFVAVSIHESAHAWVANRLGDPSAKMAGRISLNPFAHLDPMGTIFLLLAGFGWGKPVPINPFNFKNPKLDEFKVAISGPASNFLTAAILAAILRTLPMPTIIVSFLFIVILLNLILMVFNLLPIPPLDGSKILGLFLPAQEYLVLQQLGLPILFGLILLTYAGVPILPQILTYVVGGILHFLTGSNLGFF